MSVIGAPPAAIWLLVFGAAVWIAGWRVRAILLPEWGGAPGRLAEAVLAISVGIVLAELLGLIGLLEGAWLLAGAIVVVAGAALAAAWQPARPSFAAQARVRELAVAGVLAFLLIAIWMLGALRMLDGGLQDFDTLWYHLPVAADFARTGSITAIPALDPVTLARFYPADSELVHAVAMAIVHRDVVSPLLNVGWLALAMLGGWCIGRPFGAPWLSLLGTAVIVGAHVLAVSQPGNATDDIVVTAALLASAGILVNAFGPGSPNGERPGAESAAPLLVAGLAAGLAAGTKLNLLVPVAVLTVGLVLAGRVGWRRRVLGWWIAGVAATGGFWYLRNLIATGNPLPWLHAIGPLDLPGPSNPAGLRPAFTVAHYLTDGGVWSAYFLPGLHVELGDLWPLTLALAVAGMIAAIARGASPVARALGACAVAGAVAYLVTPLSAGGTEGDPIVFATNLRWLAPFLALGLALVPSAGFMRTRGARLGAVVLFVAPLVASLDLATWVDDPNLAAALIVAGVLVGAWAAAVALARSRWAGTLPARFAVPGIGAAVAIAAAIVFAPTSRDYLDDRFQAAPEGSGLTPAFAWAKGVEDADIALSGTTAAYSQYPFYGRDLSNVVTYVSAHGSDHSLSQITTCAVWRQAINHGRYDFLLTAPSFDAQAPERPLPAPEGFWAAGSGGLRQVLRDGPVAVFRVRGPLDPATCGR